MSDPAKIGVSRRTLAKGAAWTVPAAAVVAAAPAYARSLQIDPGINGWVLNSYTNTEDWPGYPNCSHQIVVDSDPSDQGPTPDGAPFGLYLYDIAPGDQIGSASMTYWIRGDNNVSWVSQGGHSTSCWGTPTRGTPAQKSDGNTYTPYTWTYSCAINAGDVSSDGRLYLADFHVRARFTLPGGICDAVCFYIQRAITVNGQVLTFERKRGFRNCSNQNINRIAPDARVGELQDRRAALEAELKLARSAEETAAPTVDNAAEIKAAQDEMAELESKKSEMASSIGTDSPGDEAAEDAAAEAEVARIDERISALKAEVTKLEQATVETQARASTRDVASIEAELKQIDKELTVLEKAAPEGTPAPEPAIPA